MSLLGVDLAVTWHAGVRRGSTASEPPIQVHHASDDLVILRQSLAVSYEAPFLYLLFGADRALLFDSGATLDAERFPLRHTVDELINGWLARHPRDGYGLVIAHSHAHSDHVAADPQFADRAATEIVGHDASDVAQFFEIADWPTSPGSIDLGGRVIRVVAIPGHEPSSIALYDEQTGLLLTGDTVYPGRLYVRDFPAFAASIERLRDFAGAHPVTAILGAHIEMSTRAKRDFPLGSTWHPHEASLPMTVGQLRAISDATAGVAGKPGAYRFADFAIYNGPSRGAIARQLVRLAWWKLLGR